MNLKTCRRIIRVLYILCFVLVLASVFVQNHILKMGLLGAGLALVAVIAVMRDKFWRCPKCGAMLPKGFKTRCTKCNWKFQ